MKATIFIISSLHWHSTWQRHQNFAKGLASHGHRVVFIEPVPKRWPGVSEMSRVWGRVFGSATAAGVCPQEEPKGVTLVSHRCLPDVGRFGHLANRKFFMPRLARRARALAPGNDPIVTINYLPTPASLHLQTRLDAAVNIYDCAWAWPDDPYSNGAGATEQAIVAKADMVLADSPHNDTRMRDLHSRVYRLAHGVEFDMFAESREPTRLNGTDPRCCYFGDIGPNLDFDLLRRISHRNPLKLIGPVRQPLVDFAARTEVVGPVPHRELPGLLRDTDALILPYRQAPHTRGVIPAKMFECLATGKPTVAMGLPGLDEYGDVFSLCATEEQFFHEIDVSTQPDDEHRQARLDCARANSWTSRAKELDGLVQQLLAET